MERPRLRIGSASKQVYLDGELIELDDGEFQVLSILAHNNEGSLSGRVLLNVLLGGVADVEAELNIDNLSRVIGTLKEKLGDIADDPVWIGESEERYQLMRRVEFF